MIVYDKLWKLLEDKNLSTYWLREKCGIDSKTIRRLKANDNMETKTLSKLCQALDCSLSDIAEYIKTCFFNDDINKLNLRYILSNLDKTDILILYSRLLYPSYYYDCCEKISNGYDEQILELYINKIDEYETFLKELYFDIKDKFYIPMIDWIIKKDLSYDKSIVHPYQMIED